MKEHTKKMIAPIIVTVVVLIYFIFYIKMLIPAVENTFLRIISGIIPALLGAVMIGVCIQRIREIKGGEEDDLSKY